MLGFKLIHVSKRGPGVREATQNYVDEMRR